MLIPSLWCGLSYFGFLDVIKNMTMDWRYQIRGELEQPIDANNKEARVVYVDFDADTVSIVGERPWDRNFLADVANIILHGDYGKAKCIGFDFIFSSQSMSMMVAPENVLKSDKAIGDLLEKHPNQIFVAGAYTNIFDENYMFVKSKPPYIVPRKDSAPISNKQDHIAFPEIPTYPIIKYQNGEYIGKIGLIDQDVYKSNGPAIRYVPTYFNYKGPSFAKNILYGRLKAFSIENGIMGGEIINNPKDKDCLQLVIPNEFGEPQLIIESVKKGNEFHVVNAEGELVDLNVNKVPLNRNYKFFHISVQLVLAYHGLDETNVEIAEDGKILRIRNNEGTILYEVPLIDKQVAEINWFTKWNPVKEEQTPDYLPAFITSKTNPRCSIKDVLYFFKKMVFAENLITHLGVSYGDLEIEKSKLQKSIETKEKMLLLLTSRASESNNYEGPISKAKSQINADKERLTEVNQALTDPSAYAGKLIHEKLSSENHKLKTINKMLEMNPALSATLEPQKASVEKEIASLASLTVKLQESERGKAQAREFFSYLHNAIVLIGPVDPIFQDLAPTPMERISVPKVSVQGNLVKTILSGKHISRMDPRLEYVITFLLCFLVGLCAVYNGDKIIRINLLGGALQIIYVVFAFYLFIKLHLVLPLIVPIGSSLSLSFVGFFILSFSEQKHKNRITKMFGSYVSKDVVEQLVHSKNEPTLGGYETEITAFFSDIQSFSTFSELLEPPKLVELMNEYLSAMTDILQNEQGTLDKYIGDAIVAMFGAPVAMSDHAYRAVKTTILCHEQQDRLRKKWKSEGDKWPECVWGMQTRIGLNTGVATVGNMGAHNRFNYTMMGDMVNLAARCESGAKAFAAYTMVSEETMKASTKTKDDILFRHLDKITVKGRSKPVNMYEVVGFRDKIPQSYKDCIEISAQAYEKYQAQDWDGARSLYRKSKELELRKPDITPGVTENLSMIFIKRCNQMKLNPPGDNWNGVYTMTSK